LLLKLHLIAQTVPDCCDELLELTMRHPFHLFRVHRKVVYQVLPNRLDNCYESAGWDEVGYGYYQPSVKGRRGRFSPATPHWPGRVYEYWASEEKAAI
jgi:hypothetical protein